MNLNDSWTKLLEAIEPDYHNLKRMNEDGPRISISLDKRRVRWWINIHEDWERTPSDQHYHYYTASDNKLAERIEWTDQQLKSWKLVSRQSYQHWTFMRRADAEKFITLFNLRWTQ